VIVADCPIIADHSARDARTPIIYMPRCLERRGVVLPETPRERSSTMKIKTKVRGGPVLDDRSGIIIGGGGRGCG
jgi:hypothetical protein